MLKLRFKHLNTLQKRIGQTRIYRLWLSPLINVLFSALGNTAGIWVGYILIKYIFSGIWAGLKWPGTESLVNDGVFLLISFSFLSAVLYQTTRRLRYNFFNITSLVLLVVVSAYYVRVVAIEQAGIENFDNSTIYRISFIAFFGSLLLLYASLVWDKFVQLEGGNAGIRRNNGLEDLKEEFP